MNQKNQPEKNKDVSAHEQVLNGSVSAEPPLKKDAEADNGFLNDNINDGKTEDAGLETAQKAGENGEVSGEAIFEEGDKDSDNVQSVKKKVAPKVSPSTMVLTFVFALVFCAAAYFFPYIEAMLPWGGSTIKGSLVVEEYTYDQLIVEADSVVVGEVSQKRDNIIQYRPTADGLGYIIYSEVDIKVEEVLWGEPYIDEDGVLVTYELGGRQEISENGRPKIIKVEYDGAAELASGERVILFLDDQNNILGEKYGVYRQHKDNYYYDDSQGVYALEDIRSDLSLRQE